MSSPCANSVRVMAYSTPGRSSVITSTTVKLRLTSLSILSSVGTSGVRHAATESILGRDATSVSTLTRPDSTASRSSRILRQRTSSVTARPMLSRTRKTSSASAGSPGSDDSRE